MMLKNTFITSGDNPQIRRLRKLESRKGRESEGLFLAEGERLVREIVSPWQVYRLVMSESFAEKHPDFTDLLEPAVMEEAAVLTLPDALFQKLALTEHAQGILAAVRMRTEKVAALLQEERPFVVVLENLQDPGNLGTLIRTADASGASGILIGRGTVDPYNPKTVRASMGSLFHLPVVQIPDLADGLSRLKEAGLKIFAAHLRGSIMHFEADYTGPSALLIGNEGNGLSDEITAMADARIRIPQPGRAESLNASVAAGILMYEVVRQRLDIH